MTQVLDDRLHAAEHSPLLSTAVRDQAHFLTGWVVAGPHGCLVHVRTSLPAVHANHELPRAGLA